MSAAVSFHRLAAAEFVTARRWYARRSRAAEARFVRADADAVRQVEANPAIGSPSTGPYRWVRLRRFSYLLHYQPVTATALTVFAVAHTSRRPGYWLGRTRRP